MSVNNLISLVKPDLEQVNVIILEAAKSETDLIPKLAKHLIDAGGKRLRPVLTLAAAKLCEYQGNRQINLAASVEFMHTATLLHDDVVDESELRRGRETANYIWGNKASVLVGDYLLGKAFQMMTSDGSIEVLKILSDAAAKIAEGEVMQLSTANNIETTYGQYLEVIKAKTAELFGAACEVMGAVIEDEKIRTELRAFGMNFGIAFQIIDDALDYGANQEELGKTVGDDLREGKVTLPVIYAYEVAVGDDKKFWEDVIATEEATDEQVTKAKDLIFSSGAYDKTIAEAKKYADLAEQNLAIFADSEVKDALIGTIAQSLSRVS